MFRREVQVDHLDRLHGDVSLTLPVSWHLIAFGFMALLSAAAAFLLFGSYARVETVTGQITPDLGSAQVLPSRTGVVTNLEVHEGEFVRASAPLITVKVEETDRSGGTGPSQVLAALSEQDSHLAAQQRSTLAGAQAAHARFQAQGAGMRAQIGALERQIDAQRVLIGVAQADYDRSQGVAARGFLSKRDLQTRQETLLGRQQQLASLDQARVDKIASLEEALKAAEESKQTAEASAAAIGGDRASIAQRRFDVEASRGYTLTAPVSGMVTAVTARIGQSVQTTVPLMTIVPAGARLEALLYVPTQAAGFLSVGEEVRLQIDAFPYSRFGTVPARIGRISSAAVFRSTGNGQTAPYYLVTASIADPRVYGFDRMHALQPDMTLTARIVTEKRSLAEWLFEPILAVRRR